MKTTFRNKNICFCCAILPARSLFQNVSLAYCHGLCVFCQFSNSRNKIQIHTSIFSRSPVKIEKKNAVEGDGKKR